MDEEQLSPTQKDEWSLRTLVVPDSHVKFASDLTVAVAGAPGANMWTAALSLTGTAPATHWIAGPGLISTKFADLLPFLEFPYDSEPILKPGNAAVVAYLANQAEFVVTPEQVQELFDLADITDQNLSQINQRLGLQLVNFEE